MPLSSNQILTILSGADSAHTRIRGFTPGVTNLTAFPSRFEMT